MSDTRPDNAGVMPDDGAAAAGDTAHKADGEPEGQKELGGRDGPDPTRYGDWEKAGRCIDF